MKRQDDLLNIKLTRKEASWLAAHLGLVLVGRWKCDSDYAIAKAKTLENLFLKEARNQEI